MTSMTIFLVSFTSYLAGVVVTHILRVRPEIERTKDWEFLAGVWQEKYWEEFRKYNDDERFSVPNIPDQDVMPTDSARQSMKIYFRKEHLDTIAPYENQR